MNLSYKIPESKQDITVAQYVAISKLYKNAKDNEVEVNENDLMAICLGIPVNIIDKLPLEDYQLANESIANALKEESVMPLTFTHKGIKYGFIPDLEDITIGEYSTLDQLMKDADENATNIINVLYRPIKKEKSYKSWFSKEERKRYTIQPYNPSNDVSVFNDLPCSIFESSLLFFWSLGTELLNATVKSTREALQTKEAEGSGKSGDGFKHLIHTLQQYELTSIKSSTTVQIRYCID